MRDVWAAALGRACGVLIRATRCRLPCLDPRHTLPVAFVRGYSALLLPQLQIPCVHPVTFLIFFPYPSLAAQAEQSAQEMSQKLMQAALDGGGKDNITVMVVKWE
jgi:hypothetical protein